MHKVLIMTKQMTFVDRLTLSAHREMCAKSIPTLRAAAAVATRERERARIQIVPLWLFLFPHIVIARNVCSALFGIPLTSAERSRRSRCRLMHEMNIKTQRKRGTRYSRANRIKTPNRRKVRKRNKRIEI